MVDAPPAPPESPPPLGFGTFATVWLTLFLDLVAFGIILPVLPFYALHFDASAVQVTLLSTAFSLAQFVMSPVLGRISDRYGRRPVMLVSIAGSCASLLTLGFAQSLAMVYVARLVSGTCNANMSTAQAYVADRVAPEQRAKYMGMMGAAGGVGFVFGPAIGGLLSTPSHPELPFLVAAGLAGVNWLLALRFLPESERQPGAGGVRAGTLNPFRRLGLLTSVLRGVRQGRGQGGVLGWLVLINFVFFLAFAAMESTFALLTEARFGWTARETGYLFTGIGVTIVLTQGVAVGRLVPRLGERRTLVLGALVLMAGLLTLGLSPWPWLFAVGSICAASGNGLISPNLAALVSRASSDHDQGLNLGISASAGSLARIIGPALAGPVFQSLDPGAPMIIGAAILVVAVLGAVKGLEPLMRAERVEPQRTEMPQS